MRIFNELNITELCYYYILLRYMLDYYSTYMNSREQGSDSFSIVRHTVTLDVPRVRTLANSKYLFFNSAYK